MRNGILWTQQRQETRCEIFKAKKVQKAKRKKKDEKVIPEVFINKTECEKKRKRIDDPSAVPEIHFKLFFRSKVPMIVERCHGNYDNKLIPSEIEDYLVVKLHGNSMFTVSGEERKKTDSQYIHLNNTCWK